MKSITVNIDINETKEKVWSVITDIKNSVNNISGIKKIDILEEGSPFKGLKWKETREMFGKEATEIMWIHDCQEYKYYHVRAESHGSKYYTNFYLLEHTGITKLTMEFSAEILSPIAKILNFIIGWMFKKATIQALKKDLEDIKKAVELGSFN